MLILEHLNISREGRSMAISKKKRLEIFNMFGGKCAYCGVGLPEKGWHVDHIEPVYREWWKSKTVTRYEVIEDKLITWEEKQKIGMTYPENDVADNMFPACASCNIEKSVLNLEGFMASLEKKINSLRNNSSAFRFAERYGLVQVIKEKVVFYFELHKEA